jgi:hypothetical protein
VQRGHQFAIVDEVDSILIDEARTPLIISGPSEESTDKYFKIDKIIPKLIQDIDYTLDEKHRTATLTEEGVSKCERLLGLGNLYDPAHMEQIHHVYQALRAHTLYKRDVDYVVKDGEVIIVDEFTGRQMPGRRWSDGLHQAVEAKEGAGKPDPGDDHLPELFPHVQKAGRHDGYGGDGSGGVREDLQPGRRGDPNEPDVDPQGISGRGVPHGDGKV